MFIAVFLIIGNFVIITFPFFIFLPIFVQIGLWILLIQFVTNSLYFLFQGTVLTQIPFQEYDYDGKMIPFIVSNYNQCFSFIPFLHAERYVTLIYRFKVQIWRPTTFLFFFELPKKNWFFPKTLFFTTKNIFLQKKMFFPKKTFLVVKNRILGIK